MQPYTSNIERSVYMGYYSNLDIDNDAYVHDASITPPEQQLFWRLDDLRDRLEELKTSGALYGGVCNYAKNDLRYAPTGYFHTIYEVEMALELAVEDLRNQYGFEEPSLQEIVVFSPYCVLQAIRFPSFRA